MRMHHNTEAYGPLDDFVGTLNLQMVCVTGRPTHRPPSFLALRASRFSLRLGFRDAEQEDAIIAGTMP